jgi:hypothetical protein
LEIRLPLRGSDAKGVGLVDTPADVPRNYSAEVGGSSASLPVLPSTMTPDLAAPAMRHLSSEAMPKFLTI